MTDGSKPRPSPLGMKDGQARKIRELKEALCKAGFVTLAQQAEVLGLGRSTTWAVLQAQHKGSGLSASVISQMLAAPGLPESVRAKLIEYIEEKVAGLYGHSDAQRHRFSARLSVECVWHLYIRFPAQATNDAEVQTVSVERRA